MRIPRWLKRTATFLLDAVELYLPMLTFTIMFLVFILSIFFRYFLNMPLTWPYEVTIFGFMWTALFGTNYTRRKHAHVKFTLTYDKATPRGKAIIRIIGNGTIALLLAASFPATLEYIQFLDYQKSTVLRIPFDIAYGPYLVFLVLTTAHCVYDIVLDAKKLVRGELSS